MIERDNQLPEDTPLTGTIEFCDEQVAGNPWQNLFELCLHFADVARQRTAEATDQST